MMRTRWYMRACAFAALGWAVGAGTVAPQEAPAPSPPMEPGGKQGTRPQAGRPPVPPGDGRVADVEALKKEIEALRRKVEALGPAQGRPGPERQKIVVTRPQAKDVVLTQQYAGTILAHRHIKVRALATGVITDIPVKEGQAVKKGDTLFKVLPTLYQAKVDAAVAEVRLAELELQNAKKLFQDKVTSQLEVALYEAKLARAQAKARLAEGELKFTDVRAPFDGLVDRVREQQGSLIKEGDVLTTLSDNSRMWVYFNVPEARYLEYMADGEPMKDRSPIELVLANGRKLPQVGKLGAIDAQFVSETGNIPFRADFPNPDRLLRHGQTGTVLIHRAAKSALLIPQRATFEQHGRHYVYVVGKADVAHPREIVVQGEVDDLFVIKTGLGVNDRVVVEGVRQVRDGEKVEYEYREPGAVTADPKKHGDK